MKYRDGAISRITILCIHFSIMYYIEANSFQKVANIGSAGKSIYLRKNDGMLFLRDILARDLGAGIK